MRRRVEISLVSAVVAAIAIVGCSGDSSAARWDQFLKQYAPEEVEAMRKNAKENNADPSDADLVGVLEFRHSCQVMFNFLRASEPRELNGGDKEYQELFGLPERSRERGQPHIATFYADQILSKVRVGDLGVLPAAHRRRVRPESKVRAQVQGMNDRLNRSSR